MENKKSPCCNAHLVYWTSYANNKIAGEMLYGCENCEKCFYLSEISQKKDENMTKQDFDYKIYGKDLETMTALFGRLETEADYENVWQNLNVILSSAVFYMSQMLKHDDISTEEVQKMYELQGKIIKFMAELAEISPTKK